MKTILGFLMITILSGMLSADKISYGFYGGWSEELTENFKEDISFDEFSEYDKIIYHEKSGFSLYLGLFLEFELSKKTDLQIEANYQQFFIKNSATSYKDEKIIETTPWDSHNEYYINLLFNLAYSVKRTRNVHFIIKTGIGPGLRNFPFRYCKRDIWWDRFWDNIHLHLRIGPEIEIYPNSKKETAPIIIGASFHYLTYRRGFFYNFGGSYICFYLGTKF